MNLICGKDRIRVKMPNIYIVNISMYKLRSMGQLKPNETINEKKIIKLIKIKSTQIQVYVSLHQVCFVSTLCKCFSPNQNQHLGKFCYSCTFKKINSNGSRCRIASQGVFQTVEIVTVGTYVRCGLIIQLFKRNNPKGAFGILHYGVTVILPLFVLVPVWYWM